MTACSKCDGFKERLNFSTLRDYLDIVRQLIQIVSEGTFLLVHADCPLRDMFNTPIPGDCVTHDFQCTGLAVCSNFPLTLITATQIGRNNNLETN